MTSKVKGAVFFVIIATCLGCLAQAAQSSVNAASAQVKRASGKRAAVGAAQARTLYMQNCARCHGADGRGQTDQGEIYGAQDLTDAKVMGKLNNKRAASIISRGGKGMPSFAKKLSQPEIAALAAFVRTFKAER
jgi:mono/diheme cytochrome c family protein